MDKAEIVEKYDDYGDMLLRKSNMFINGKYKASLLENKIMAIGMSKAEAYIRNIEEVGEGPFSVVLYPGEIKNIMGRNMQSKNIYRDLKQIAQTIIGKSVVVDKPSGGFEAFSVITNAIYENGCFTLVFNNSVRPHLFGLSKNYDTLHLRILMVFKRNSTFRLYEILSQYRYKCNPKVNNGIVMVNYGLSELRFSLGIANSNETAVRRIIGRSESDKIDWDYLYDHVVIEKNYSNWTDFKRWVLIPAQEEMREKSDICFDFKPVRQGRKVASINFYIYLRPDVQTEEIVLEQEEYQYDFTDLTKLYENYEGLNGLQKEDIMLLFEKSQYNEELVNEAFAAADQQEKINNYMGWLIAYIERGGYKQVETSYGSEDLANQYKTLKDYQEDTKRAVWEKVKNGEQYMQFLHDIGISETILEETNTVDELMNLYTEWRIAKTRDASV